MRGIVRSIAWAGPLVGVAGITLLAAGCSGSMPARYRASAQGCYAFSVQALRRHTTVAEVPQACAGLSHAQVNLAVTRAVREMAGPLHKAAQRRQAHRDTSYLARLIRAVPPGRPAAAGEQGQPAAATGRSSAGLPFSLAALAAWCLTAAAGLRLLVGWLSEGGPLGRRLRPDGIPPAIIIGHLAIAVAGLGIWIAFVAADLPVLAWIAAGLILPAAGLGMATLVTTLPEPAPSAAPGGTGPSGAVLTVHAVTPARTRAPVTLIALHGILATVTILLVLLAAVGAG